MKEDQFFTYRNQIKPEKGRLLISEPFLADPNFERTVVLLCEHNEDGSFGFVLNKPSVVQVNEVVESIHNIESVVYVGGPVQQDTMHFLHRSEEIEGSTEIRNGIFWGGSFDSLLTVVDVGKVVTDDIRFFLGYSGWGPGQLESELKEDSWIVCDYVDSVLLFETEAKMMWKRALDSMGGRFSMYSNYPLDPRLN